jgi:hypothetical protein
MSEITTADRVLAAFRRSPQPSLAVIAAEVGVSRERVRQLLKTKGLRSSVKSKGRPRVHSDRKPVNRFGYAVRAPTLVTGAVSELVAAADLLARGWHVYRAIAGGCMCDLIACLDGATYRVEVRSATVSATGVWKTNQKPKTRENYDVLALVAPNGEIRYDPDPFTVAPSA